MGELVKRVVGVLLGYVGEVIGFGCPIADVVISVPCAIKRDCSSLVQYVQQARQDIIAVGGVDAVGSVEGRAATESVIAKAKLAGQRVRQRGDV
jgi:hypothetical protein